MLRFLLMLLAFAVSPAAAQELLPKGRNAIVPELVAEGPVAPGGEVELAIVMHTAPGWHGYWLNPGDAGLPMTIEWNLPKGAGLGPLRYPVPSKLLISDIVNYVYERDHAILLRLKAPADARGVIDLSARARWLACTDKVCVPEQGSFSTRVTVGNGSPADRARFDGFRRLLPRPLAAPARFEIKGDTLRLAIPLPASVATDDAYFFPAEDGPIDYAAPQKFTRSGDTLIAELHRRRGEPATLGGVLALGDGTGLEISAVPGSVPASGVGSRALLFAILGALAGGIVLNLMPCVFPILALKALHLARSGGDQSAARRDALAYTAGAVIGTGLLGVALLVLRASGVAAGWAFQLQDPRTILLLALLATAITLNLLRIFELPVLGGERSPHGAFGTGAVAAFVATPCAGPFLGVALGTALLLPPAGSVAVFAALGLGLALPFVAVAFVPALRSRLPKPGPWMARLQRFLAIPMGLTALAALWLLWRQGGPAALAIGAAGMLVLGLLLLGAGQRQRSGSSIVWALPAALAMATLLLVVVPSQPRVTQNPLDNAWNGAAVARELKAGHPVFVYFTADWCLTCKVNETGAIDRASVREVFRKAGVVTLVGDWTNGDPEITRFLDSRGRAGVPLYLWYEPGAAEPEELPQILTPAMLSSRAARPR